MTEPTRSLQLGDLVTKPKGASWTGRVIGFYSTALTPVGYAVESVNEPGSVQIYPERALMAVTEPTQAELVKRVAHLTADEMEYSGNAPWHAKQPIEEHARWRGKRQWVPLDAAISELQFWQRRDYEHTAAEELMRARIIATDQYVSELRAQLAAKDQEIGRLRAILGHVTDCLVEEMGNLANEDELQDEDLAATLGKDYARQVVAARLYIRQSRAALKGPGVSDELKPFAVLATCRPARESQFYVSGPAEFRSEQHAREYAGVQMFDETLAVIKDTDHDTD